MYAAGVTSQRIAPFRAGRRLVFARYLGELYGQAEAVWWADEPCCLVRWSFDTAELVRESTASQWSGRLRASSRGPRLMGMAAPRAGDGLVIVHEHPDGARMVTSRADGMVAERTWREGHGDLRIATDGRRIVHGDSLATTLTCHDSWSLEAPRPWSLEPVKRALGDVRMQIRGLRDLGDSLLISTTDTWSRWRWDGELLACWRGPWCEWSGPYLLAWHPDGPVVFMQMIDPETGRTSVHRDGAHLVVWDLQRGTPHSLGTAHDWPRATRSPDGRWLVADRVTRAGRGLELWDLTRETLVERLDIRRRAALAMAFAPDSAHVAVATAQDFFVLRVAD